MSKEDLSADTEVVLLLCGRFGGEKQEAYPPLAPGEYGELAKWLKALALRPSDLLTDAGRVALASVQEARLERKRVEFLLGRGTAMALALERWARGGLWVISRADVGSFPQRLKDRLKNAAPPLLYGAGDKERCWRKAGWPSSAPVMRRNRLCHSPGALPRSVPTRALLWFLAVRAA